MTAPTTRETADHAELARLAEAFAGEEWTSRGSSVLLPYDGYSLIMAEADPRGEFEDEHAERVAAFIAAANPATVLALLSEIAALKGERDGLIEAAAARNSLLEITERQRDELRTEAVYLLRHVQVSTSAIHDPEYKAAGYRYQVTPMANATHDRIRTFLDNQGADQ